MVSLFSILVGAALPHSMLTPGGRTVVVFWTGLQKLSGSSAVLIGVPQSVMAPTRLLGADYAFLAGYSCYSTDFVFAAHWFDGGK